MTDRPYILLVEDNPDDEALALRAFRMNNILHPVTVARTGREALELLVNDRLRPLPRVVFLDLNLPEVPGLEVLRRMRQESRTRLVPVVILTSSREERDVMNGYQLGANSYIRKPVDFDQFTAAVRELGAYWLELNEPPPMSPAR